MSAIYQKLIRPLLFTLPAETAHEFGIESLRLSLGTAYAQKVISRRLKSSADLAVKRFGLDFRNPLGVAAGFDKNGTVVNQLAALGFGFVEVGTITFEPQKGNPKPRLFRLSSDRGLINRLGFNNQGAPQVVERLKKITPGCIVGINIGKNRDVPNSEAAANYLAGFDLAFDVADYIAVNVSSPNTPDLRELQKPQELENLLSVLQQRNAELSKSRRALKPLLIKIAPDLSEGEIEAIVDISMRMNLAGIIATNTTIDRNRLKMPKEELEKIGAGGLSGKPLEQISNGVIRKIYRYSQNSLPIIGVGGIFDAEDAFAKIAAGACLLQAYTGFVFQGITFARDINKGLGEIMREKGFRNLDEAIGSEANL